MHHGKSNMDVRTKPAASDQRRDAEDKGIRGGYTPERNKLPPPRESGGRGWISVKNRYPSDARDVRAYSPQFGIHTACFQWGNEDDPCWWSDEVKTAAYKESVTWWRELN